MHYRAAIFFALTCALCAALSDSRFPSQAQSQSGFTINLPLEPSDAANNGIGFWPFGTHASSHAEDGHPGWDFEFKLGASVRAAAGGVVQNVFTDVFAPDKKTIQINHNFNGRNYRTVYTNISAVAAGLAADTRVSAGQPIGTAGAQTFNLGGVNVTYAMTHFQLDDFSYSGGLTNKNAVSPEQFLNAIAHAQFEALWRAMAYDHELTEPFTTNPRDVTFPLTRAWTKQTGSLAARIEFKRMSGQASDYEYALYAADGAVSERGKATVRAKATPLSTIDFAPSSGGARLGVYDILNDTLQIDYSPVGAARPASLSNATVYKTNRPPAASVSAASFQATPLAPESIVAAFGSGLAATTRSATVTPLPDTLANTVVRVRDSAGSERAAAIFFVSPAQVNYQMPPQTVAGAAQVTIIEGSGVLSEGAVTIAPVAPGIFAANANGQGVAAAVVLRVRADGSQVFEPVARFDAAQNSFVTVPIDLSAENEQVFLILYGTGFRGRSALSAVTARVGTLDAPVSFAGAQGELVGLDQINLRLPRVLSGRGEIEVQVTVDGASANVVKINLR